MATSRILDSFLYDINPRDGKTFFLVTVILGVVALLACLWPALRAMRVAPAEALKYD